MFVLTDRIEKISLAQIEKISFGKNRPYREFYTDIPRGGNGPLYTTYHMQGRIVQNIHVKKLTIVKLDVF